MEHFRADRSHVRAMRARLMLKVMSLVIMLVLTVVTARSCSGGDSKSSPLDPANLARNGVAGLCANEQATAQAESGNAGDSSAGSSAQTLAPPSALSQIAAGNPGGYNALNQALGGSLSCPTTTQDLGGGG